MYAMSPIPILRVFYVFMSCKLYVCKCINISLINFGMFKDNVSTLFYVITVSKSSSTIYLTIYDNSY